MKSIQHPLYLVLATSILHLCHGIARFQMNGPVLTVTLKDPVETPKYSSTNDDDDEPNRKWFDLNNLSPNLSWNFASLSKPLPNWLPSLQSLRFTANYNHQLYRRNVEGLATFQAPANVKVQVQTSATPMASSSFLSPQELKVQLQKGSFQVLIQVLANRGISLLRACYQTHQVPGNVLGGIRVIPQLDLIGGSSRSSSSGSSSQSSSSLSPQPSCLLEATTSSQRTKTVLNLEYQNPTLSIVHALDERHVIAPEISLYNAKITYQWDVQLDSRGSSIRTKVDPTQAVHVTWTDVSVDNGRWVTDVRLPLAGTTLQHLAADVRVRRQFQF